VNFSNDAELEFRFDELLRHLLDAPLFEKPEIGSNPFQPMENSGPDRTADGIKEIMIAVSQCFNKTSSSYIRFSDLLNQLTMHRIAVDKYLLDAKNSRLLASPQGYSSRIVLTQKGREYLFEHQIVEL